MKKIFYILATSVAIFLGSCKEDEAKPSKSEASIHLTLGNPSNARIDENTPENYLMSISQYALSYNSTKGHANWVSWIVDNSWLGSVDRTDNFRPNDEIPIQWYRVNHYDYFSPPNGTTPTGFDRGHMCPSADRTKIRDDNSATFLMTNMIPQAPRNNQQTWASLEDYTRSLVGANSNMGAYVISGTYGTGGDCPAGKFESLQRGKINVPERTWKIIVLMPLVNTGSVFAPLGTIGDDATRVNNNTRVIAVDMPNSQTINTNWRTYRVSVDFLEQKTGLDFLSRVPQSIQDVIEARVDNL